MLKLKEKWLQDVAESVKVPALNPAICKLLLSVVEVQVRKLVQQAHKFQRRAKSSTLTGTI
jgi:hypothetical protein